MMKSHRHMFWLLSILFFLSGATGLAYEVVWFKHFSHLWGSSSVAMATVVASFLLGLGAGANFVGGWADRLGRGIGASGEVDPARPLRFYGFAELAIGCLALLVPWEIGLLSPVSAGVEGLLPDTEFARLLARFLLTLVVLGPPCFLMGGTLPLVVRFLTTRSLSDAIGWLYGVNTLGAAMGCYAAGFHLLPMLGLVGTNNVAVTTNLAIGLVAIRAARPRLPAARGADSAPRPTGATSEPFAAPPGQGWQRWAMLFAAALSGCAALILQITWTRQLATTLGGSTYAFSATLFVVLIGMAAGGMIYHVWLRRQPRLELAVAMIVLVIAASTVATHSLLPWLCHWVAANQDLRSTLWGNALACVFAGAILELAPSIMAGALFPLLVQLTRQSPANVGQVVGNLYAWNTAGSIVGAGLTAILLFPVVGTAGAIALALGLYLLLGLVLVASWRPLGALPLACLAAGAVCALVVLRPIDPLRTNMGLYLYGEHTDEQIFQGETLFFREGQSCNVLVTTDGSNRSLRVNGKTDASSHGDMTTQLGLAYFPRSFQPDAKNVLVIGYGSGATVGASLLFPHTKVTCCEIEPAVFEASRYFGEVNHHPEKSPCLTMVLDDGRSFLERTPDQFDLIISEPSNPWIAGVAGLFTREFFETAKQRLRPGGVLAQWVQTYTFSLSEYALIVRTLKSVFPHQGLIVLTSGYDTILLAADRPLAVDRASIARFQAMIDASPPMSRDLDRTFSTSNFRYLLLNYFVGGETALAELIALQPATGVNTDVNLRLEFAAPLRLFDRSLREENVLAEQLADLRTASWLDQLGAELGLTESSPEFQLVLGNQALSRDLLQPATEHFKAAIAGDPRLTEAEIDLANIYVKTGQTKPAIEVMQRLILRDPTELQTRASLARAFSIEHRYQEACDQYREILRIDPKMMAAKNNLAWIMATCPVDAMRNGAESLRLAEEVCRETNFQDAAVLDLLGAALAETGDFERAAHIAALAASKIEETDPETRAAMQGRMVLYQQGKPYRSQ